MQTKKNKYLITGANGFIGLNLINKLVTISNTRIIAVAHNKPNYWLSEIETLNPKLMVVNCDLTKFKEVDKLIKIHKPAHVIHLATKGLRSEHWNNSSNIVSSNFLMTLNLLESLKENQKNLKSFINFGSIYEYGDQSGSMVEEDETDYGSHNAYAVSKRITTVLSRSYAGSVPVVILRLATAYGPFNSNEKFIEGTIYKALSKKEIKVAKGVIKDFVYVDDVVDAIVKTTRLANKLTWQTINIGSGQGYTLERVSDHVVKIINPPNIKEIYKVSKQFQRKQETSCWTNIDKAQRLLNWKPNYSLEQGIELTVNWYKNNNLAL